MAILVHGMTFDSFLQAADYINKRNERLEAEIRDLVHELQNDMVHLEEAPEDYQRTATKWIEKTSDIIAEVGH